MKRETLQVHAYGPFSVEDQSRKRVLTKFVREGGEKSNKTQHNSQANCKL